MTIFFVESNVFHPPRLTRLGGNFSPSNEGAATISKLHFQGEPNIFRLVAVFTEYQKGSCWFTLKIIFIRGFCLFWCQLYAGCFQFLYMFVVRSIFRCTRSFLMVCLRGEGSLLILSTVFPGLYFFLVCKEAQQVARKSIQGFKSKVLSGSQLSSFVFPPSLEPKETLTTRGSWPRIKFGPPITFSRPRHEVDPPAQTRHLGPFYLDFEFTS